MNIIYVLYETFKSNSAIHVHNFANAFALKDHECVIAVPKQKESAEKYIGGEILYKALNFSDTLKPNYTFPDGRGADIIHAWTPRENVRKHCSLLKEKYPLAKLIVHLEDNEEVLLSNDIPMTINELIQLPENEIDHIVPEKRSHPEKYKTFLKESDGITIIMDTLADFVPENKDYIILWPIIDCDRFRPAEAGQHLRLQLGISENETVLCYTGNVHSGNAREVRSLYLAVALANREGTPARLIRTGKDYCDFLGENGDWAHEYSIELGVINSKDIPEYLALSDILIQPGSENIFNNYRLPSKIPEYLAMGKPVAVPNTNIGRFLKDREEVILLQKGDSLEILDVIKMIKGNRILTEKISSGGRKYAMENFNRDKNSERLEFFYEKIMNDKPGILKRITSMFFGLKKQHCSI